MDQRILKGKKKKRFRKDESASLPLLLFLREGLSTLALLTLWAQSFLVAEGWGGSLCIVGWLAASLASAH